MSDNIYTRSRWSRITVRNKHNELVESWCYLRMEHDPLVNLPHLATGEMLFQDKEGVLHPTNRYFLVPSTQALERIHYARRRNNHN